MATETLSDIKTAMLLNNGVTVTGAVRTVSVSLGSIDKSNYNVDKARALAIALEPLLTKSVYTLQTAKYYKITS